MKSQVLLRRTFLWCMRAVLLVSLTEPPLFSVVAQAQEAAPPPAAVAKTSGRTDRLAERDRLQAEAQRLRIENNLSAALVVGREKLAIEREVLLADAEALFGSFIWLAEVAEAAEDWKQAENFRAEALAWSTKHRGLKHWRTTDARLALEQAQKLPSLTVSARFDLAHAAGLREVATLLSDAGKFNDAIAVEERARDLLKQVLGETHNSYATSLNDLALLYVGMGDYARAEPLYVQAIQISKQTLGENHPRYATTLNNLADLYASMGDYARAERNYFQSRDLRKQALGEVHPDYARSLNSLALLYHRMGAYARAEPLYIEALKIQKQILGEEHRDYATSLCNLAALYDYMGDYARAEPIYIQAVKIQKQNPGLGEVHPEYGRSLNNLAGLYELMGDYARAEPLYVQAIQISKQTLGENHPGYATTLNNLASLYASMGHYARAEPRLLQAAKIQKQALGEMHPDYATSLSNLAGLYELMGDYTRAAPLYLQTINIRKQALGEVNPAYAQSLSNLAKLYEKAKNYARAEPLYVEACDIFKAVLSVKHPLYAKSLHDLASLHMNMGDYARAEPLYVEARDIFKAVLGVKHPLYSKSLHDLASLYMNMGDYARAEPLYVQAMQIIKQALGEMHPDYATSLNSLARLHVAMDRPTEAESLLLQSLSISRSSLEATALIQSERQQLAMGQSLRYQLDAYVSLGASTGKYARTVFSQVLVWKGATLVRQRGIRLGGDDPAMKEQFTQLQRTAAQLASLSRAAPGKEDEQATWRTKLSDLTHRKERLESELSAKSAPFRLATKEITLDDLLASLPKDAVLVDYLEFDRFTPSKAKGVKATRERQLVAFVVRHAEKEEDQVKMIPLGPVAPVSAAIDTWRTTFGMDPSGAAAGRTLREALWQPLVGHLGDARTILVSTDGVLGRMPLGALPGKEPGTYLLEDHRVALIPVPQLLPTLVNPEGQRRLSKELLLLGDVDYDSAPGDFVAVSKKEHPRRAGENRSPTDSKLFEPLAGASGEIATIEKLYGQIFEVKSDDPRALVQAQADEGRFRSLAPQYRHLHLATHGFFAGERFVSALGSRGAAYQDRAMAADRLLAVTGYNPGLLSGLALTGANLEPSSRENDGILTAQEIGVMDLSGVDTVVLSACDTGLGQTAGGEGLLGVQRAFQTAGARTTVASFWKVDDLVTRFLMERFYRNLWEKDMSRLDALREAQLYVLRHPEEVRGGDAIQNQDTAEARTSPRYWAAFSLSGDWR